MPRLRKWLVAALTSPNFGLVLEEITVYQISESLANVS